MTQSETQHLYILIPNRQMDKYRHDQFFLWQANQIFHRCEKVCFHDIPPITLKYADDKIFVIMYVPPACGYEFFKFVEKNIENPRLYVFTDNNEFIKQPWMQNFNKKRISQEKFSPLAAMDALRSIVAALNE